VVTTEAVLSYTYPYRVWHDVMLTHPHTWWRKNKWPTSDTIHDCCFRAAGNWMDVW